jgi:tetratricopeptide (TPR) repeat protein
LDPNRAEAKAMRAQLDGEPADAKAAAKPEAKAEVAKADKPVPEAHAAAAKPEHVAKAESAKAEHVAKVEHSAKPEPAKVAHVEAKPAPEEPRAPAKDAKDAKDAKGDGKKADFSAGLSAYHNRQWTPAVQAFDAIAAGPASKDQKAKAAAYAAAVRQVEASMNEAQSAAANSKKAIAAWKQAYNADRRVDGTHGAFIAGKLADGYLAQSKANLSAKKYSEAFEDAQEALNYQPDKAEANQIVDKCMQQATTMLKDAKDLMEKKNYLGARDLARTVAHILPASDKRAQEAQDIAKKATELSRQDAD